MTPLQRWKHIQNFIFPPYFYQLLSQRQSWKENFTLQAVEEYKNFMYLATYSSVTPSVVIDEVWHLHIQWTSLYENFCHGIFDRNFCHHQPEFLPPSNGISAYREQYYATLERYYWEYNCHPPNQVWSYELDEGVKVKRTGRKIPLSCQFWWQNPHLLLSPALVKVIIPAKTKRYINSSSVVADQDINSEKILQWQFPQGFAQRLAREQGWSFDEANKTIQEYLQFQVIQSQEVVYPSPKVEKVWFLHLLATKNYQQFSALAGVNIIPHTFSV